MTTQMATYNEYDTVYAKRDLSQTILNPNPPMNDKRGLSSLLTSGDG